MHSILIISKDSSKREDKALAVCKDAGIDSFDVTIVKRAEQAGKTGETKLKQSLGIEDIKTMQKTLYLKPFRGQKKAIIVHDAHLLTTEAQNALLKTLEEPPDNTIIMLSSETEEALLPTVRSRCQIITLEQRTLEVTAEEKRELLEFLYSMNEWSTGASLKAAERLTKNKEETIIWLEKLILVTREELLSQTIQNTRTTLTSHYLVLIKRLQETHKTIKTTNVNLRLALEQCFLK